MLALMFLRAACLDGGPNFTFDDSIPLHEYIEYICMVLILPHTHTQ
jgi:hypothetical protein